MLKLRLQRVGRKHHFSFRVVLTDSKNSANSGKYLEVLGTYDPKSKARAFKKDEILTRIAQGAQISETLHNLLVTEKIIEGKKVNALPKKTAPKKEAPVEVVKEVAPIIEKEEALVVEVTETESTEEIVA
jgi:small subunit ribosomal protein S16